MLDNENEPIKCIVESVQVQSDTALCGLFAIAFAYDLCAGLRDPCGEYYNEEKMRKHLFRCLSDGEFTEFPKLYENEEDRCERSVRREFEIFIWEKQEWRVLVVVNFLLLFLILFEKI